MALITDPRVIRYVNEVVRPLAERIKLLSADIAAEQAAFDQTIAPIVFTAGDNDTVDDGQPSANAVTKADLYAFNNLLGAVKDAANPVVINKPCVRFLVTR